MGQQYLLPNHLVPGLNKLRVLRFIKDQFTLGVYLCLHSSWETHGFVCGSQTNRHFRSKSRWLASYLQRVISVHHPTVSPGRHNQKRSGAKGQGAGNILKKIPHGRRQTGKGRMGRCQPSWNAIDFRCYWPLMPVPRDESAQVYAVPHPSCKHLKLQKDLCKQAVIERGSWRSLSSCHVANQKPGQGKSWAHCYAWKESRLWANLNLWSQRPVVVPRWRTEDGFQAGLEPVNWSYSAPWERELFSSPLEGGYTVDRLQFYCQTILIFPDYLRQTSHQRNYAKQVLAQASSHSNVLGRTLGRRQGPRTLSFQVRSEYKCAYVNHCFIFIDT